jgi:surfactin synthase thioesterase subunit
MPSHTSPGGRWIRRYHPSAQSGARLVCFPHAGGSANYYFPLSRALAPAVEVLSVQYPGRQDRLKEKLIGCITELADAIFAVLQPWAGGPAAFFGHSMGATVAFEVARRFQEQTGSAPLRLLVSGRGAPSLTQNDGVHLRDNAGIVAELRRLGGTAERFVDDKEWLGLILPIIRNDYKAIETYSYLPGPPLNCPITALAGDRDPKVTTGDLRAWAWHCTGPLEIRTFPGGHFYLDSRLPDVAETVSSSLWS